MISIYWVALIKILDWVWSVTDCVDNDRLVCFEMVDVFEFEVEVWKLGHLARTEVNIAWYEAWILHFSFRLIYVLIGGFEF